MAGEQGEDVLILALTIYGEARGERTQQAKEAVAWVVKNRVLNKTWWGKDVEGYEDHSYAAVCLKPWQFSCWNDNDPNRPKLEQMYKVGARALDDPQFRRCMHAAIGVYEGLTQDDPTQGSTHYIASALLDNENAPGWALNSEPVVRIGNHAFFNDVQ